MKHLFITLFVLLALGGAVWWLLDTSDTPQPGALAPSPPANEERFSLLRDAQTRSLTPPAPSPVEPPPAAEPPPQPTPVEAPQQAAAPPPAPTPPPPAPAPAIQAPPPPASAAKPIGTPRKSAPPAPVPAPPPAAAPPQTAFVPPPAPPARFDGVYAGRTDAHGCQSDRVTITISGADITVQTVRGTVHGKVGADGGVQLSGFENPQVMTPLSIEGRLTGSAFVGSGSVQHCQFDFRLAKNE
ncbi:MAG TPA: hypothetical protein VM689_05680 [Aliidongia sp.]|nr:hypothetical protein [Aliidongia sp.]